MLKFLLKKKRLDFMTGWMTEENEMLGGSRTEGSQPEVLLGSLLSGDTETARDALLVDDMNLE